MIKEINELAEDFANKFTKEEDDPTTWEMFYKSAIFFYDRGKLDQEKLELSKQIIKIDEEAEVARLTKEIVLRMYSDSGTMDIIFEQPVTMGEGIQKLTFVAHQQARSIMSTLNKTKDFTPVEK